MADDYRQRCADAIFNRIASATIVLHSSVTDLVGKKPGDVTEYDLADAVLAVRDQDMEMLRSENEDLRKRADAAEQEVARLRAGESLEPPVPGTMHTPAQWLRRYNDATPEKRLQVVEHVQDSAERAYRCVMADHEGMRAELHRVQAVVFDLTALVRDLADREPCEDFDHDGHCQTHGWLQDGTCPHARARDILTAQEAGEGRG